MTYAELINLVIIALTYGLEIGIVISNQFLELDENGFYFVENKSSEEKKLYKAFICY